jgi:hypothetical protein
MRKLTRRGFLVVVTFIFVSQRCLAFFGSEMLPLVQLVSGQITEIERLTENIGVAKDQMTTLKELNQGVDRAVSQIYNLQSIIERAQGLDPTATRSLSDLNDLLSRAQQSKEQLEGLLSVKVQLADEAITSSAMQGDTAYKMGQEMVATGTRFSEESKTASPGRASQITAASNSAQMLATGVQLQTMSQMVQLQAMSLEFQKSQVERDLQESKMRRKLYEKQLVSTAQRTRNRGPQ